MAARAPVCYLANTIVPARNSPRRFPALPPVLFLVCDWDRFSKNDFLGQATLRMARTPGMWSKEQSVQLPLGDCHFDPFDAKAGKPIRMGDTDQKGQGEITLSVAPVFSSTSASLRVERKVKLGKLKGTGWAPYWLILIKSQVLFVDPNMQVVEEKPLTAFESLTKEGTEVMVRETGGAKPETFRLTDEETAATRFFDKVAAIKELAAQRHAERMALNAQRKSLKPSAAAEPAAAAAAADK